jgi:ADP-ribosylglycohydrolase
MKDAGDHGARIEAARRSLDGLSVGDAFGQLFFNPDVVRTLQSEKRELPSEPWKFTDDTVMAISIVDVLSERQQLDQELLAGLFAARYAYDPYRGYGGAAHEILTEIGAGGSWRRVSAGAFGGTGSMGNGGAMRVAPIGAYFADDLSDVIRAARKSAEVTHAHAEGQAGAIAVAVAAAWVVRGGTDPDELFETVLRNTPPGDTRAGIEVASQLGLFEDVGRAVAGLGNGSRVISPDTVPFSLWCVARHLGDFEEAMWTTVSGLGDRDTTCAIVGGIVSLGETAAIPADWLRAREPLENMARERIGA